MLCLDEWYRVVCNDYALDYIFVILVLTSLTFYWAPQFCNKLKAFYVEKEDKAGACFVMSSVFCVRTLSLDSGVDKAQILPAPTTMRPIPSFWNPAIDQNDSW